MKAAFDLITGVGGIIYEAVAIVEIKSLKAREKFSSEGYGDVSVYSIMDEKDLTLNGLEDDSIDTDGYIDDGEAHQNKKI